MQRPPITTLTILFPALLLACTDTSRYSTAWGESYCGTNVGASFVRAGVAADTTLRLELDADNLQRAPGRIWTGPLESGERLDAAELRVIPQLLHDPLSTLSFGEGRVKNSIAVVDMGSSQLFVVLSLMKSEEVEVRLIRGASPGSAPDGGTASAPSQIFGVWRLQKKQGDCGLGGARASTHP